MNVLVCFKAVADLDKLSECVIQNNEVEIAYIPKIFNCFDESALEIVLKLSEKSEGFRSFFQTTALTIGDGDSDRFLQLLSALKFDDTIRIECKEDIRFRPKTIAENIVQYIKEYPQDLIFMGNKAGVGDNGQTHFYVAEQLQLPCITNVMEVERNRENTITVTYETDDAYVTKEVVLPVVLAVGNSQNAYLRVPTLKDKMYAKKNKSISIMEMQAMCEETMTLQSLSEKRSERACETIDGATLEEKVDVLYEKYLKERLEEL